MTQYNDTSARLLAQENISIVRSAVSTASFDIKNRVLTLPQWKDMTPQIEDMLQCHEVGHALYTAESDWMSAIDAFKISHPSEVNLLRGYLNVIEDARIESLIKDEFPGIAKSFYAGYRALHERDFFAISDCDINDLVLIDRINLQYKIGFLRAIKFTDTERVLMRRAGAVKSIAEAAALAIEIYEFSLQQNSAKQLESDQDDVLSDEYSDDCDDYCDDDYYNGSDDTGNDDETDETNKASHTDGQDSGSDLRATTSENFDKKLGELADNSIEYRYYGITPLEYNPIVSYKTVLHDTAIIESRYTPDAIKESKRIFADFYKEITRSVDYLIKEFEMKKSADSFARTTISKTGSIDMNKVFKYKLAPDIFRRISVVPHGQKHGMVFLLDWSASMRGTIKSTIHQAISLALFCRKMNIPFEVFAFTDSYTSSNIARNRHFKLASRLANAPIDKQMTLFTPGSLDLLNLFSSNMTASEFTTAARRFATYRIWHHDEKYKMNATPLNGALIHMIDYLPVFMKNNQVQKMSLITLTDGESDELLTTAHGKLRTHDYNICLGASVNIKNFIRDPVTKKNYEIVADGGKQTAQLLSIIQDRLGVKSIGFYICNKAAHYITRFIVGVCNRSPRAGEVQSIRSNIGKQGYHSMRGFGRDAFFLMYSNSLTESEETIEIDASANAKNIAKKFSKQLGNKRLNRNLLEKFVSIIA